MDRKTIKNKQEYNMSQKIFFENINTLLWLHVILGWEKFCNKYMVSIIKQKRQNSTKGRVGFSWNNCRDFHPCNPFFFFEFSDKMSNFFFNEIACKKFSKFFSMNSEVKNFEFFFNEFNSKKLKKISKIFNSQF